MSLNETSLRDIDLGLAIMQNKQFKLIVSSEGHTFMPIYTTTLKFGDLFLFKAAPGAVAVGRAMEVLIGGYNAFLVPNKTQGTKYLGTVAIENEDIICRLERYE